MSQPQHKGRWVLLGMVLFFSAPVVIVLLMHYLNVRPTGESHGILMSEITPITLPAQNADSHTLWQEKWSLVYVAEECGQICQDKIHDMRQIHASLEKDIPRVQRILFVKQAPQKDLLKQYPDMLTIAEVNTVSSVQQQVADKTKSNEPNTYLVDPYGNLVMRFPASLPAKDIRKDLVKLLKYSWAA